MRALPLCSRSLSTQLRSLCQAIGPSQLKGSFTKFTLYSVEARVALNPRLQLSGLLQKSNVTGSLGTNVRFSWEFAPLSYFYIVFNNNSMLQNNSFLQPVKTVDRQTITKISYLKQF